MPTLDDDVAARIIAALLGAALLALTLHVGYMVRKFGLWTSWQKSVARKGSYTSGVYHLWAVWTLRAAQAAPNPASEAEAERLSRNLHAWFWRKTGEVASPEGKLQKYEAMMEKRGRHRHTSPQRSGTPSPSPPIAMSAPAVGQRGTRRPRSRRVSRSPAKFSPGDSTSTT
jgi:hypothetical protein